MKITMTTNDKIRDEKLQYNANKKAEKISVLPSGNYQEYHCHEYHTDEEILPSNQNQIIEQAKFTYSPLGKVSEKEIKIIESQSEKQIKTMKEHGIQLVKSNGEKDSPTLLKRWKIYVKLISKSRHEIQNLSKRINYNNLTYYFKIKESSPKYFIRYKLSLCF